MSRRGRCILFAVLSLGIICFIFGNSLQGSENSNALSRDAAGLLAKLLAPFGITPSEAFHKFVRKLAHFTEFGALGVCLSGLSVNVIWPRRGLRGVAPMGLSALVAAADETIQMFTGRTAMVKDVLLDCTGAAAGICLTLLCCCLAARRAYHRGGQ